MPNKSIRFQELVKTAGRPEVVSLWTDPKRDAPFMKAVKENRVLTVIQKPTGNRKDFGQIGFHPEPHASYFIFPEPLPKPDDSRVIGIKYDLIAQSEVKDPLLVNGMHRSANGTENTKTQSKSSAEVRAARAKIRKHKTFQVLIRRIAVIETTVEVAAASRRAAARMGVDRVKHEAFDTRKAVLRHEVKAVE